MIGVVFALGATFGPATGIEDAALAHVWQDAARRLGFDDDFGKAAVANARAALFSPATVVAALSTALGPTLAATFDRTRFEAELRMASARVTAGRFVPAADVRPALRDLADLNLPRLGLSTGWPSIDRQKADLAGLREPIVFAQDLGLDGRDPATYAVVARTLRLPAEQIWLVGTDPRSEIVPAAAAGLRTVWLNRDERPFPADHRPPDATIATFAEVTGVLSEPYTRGVLALRYILRSALDWRPGYFIPAEPDDEEAP